MVGIPGAINRRLQWYMSSNGKDEENGLVEETKGTLKNTTVKENS
jgi:hypothetical protein